jgi:hypothetical protein
VGILVNHQSRDSPLIIDLECDASVHERRKVLSLADGKYLGDSLPGGLGQEATALAQDFVAAWTKVINLDRFDLAES